MSSVSFDPVAHMYDATRGYPEEIAQRIARSIDHTVQGRDQTTFLELGVGTGRIGLPLASLGRTYTGVDISERMLEQLEMKLRLAGWHEHGKALLPWGSLVDEDQEFSPVVSRFTRAEPPSSLRLVRANMEHLPFRNISFDAVLAVHVFHLVADVQRAISEALRVLRPGGWLLNCWDGYQVVEASRSFITMRWREIVRELQGEAVNGGKGESSFKVRLRERGLQVEEECVFTWQEPFVPSEVIEQISRRVWSSSWRIPDPVFAESLTRLRAWANDYYGEDIHRERMQERYFTIGKTRIAKLL